MPESLVVVSTGKVLAHRLTWARTPFARVRGLLGRPPLAPGEALVFEGAHQLHTVGLSYPIDVLFCSPDWLVLHMVRSLPPLRITRWVRRARYALELPARTASDDVQVGDRLALADL